MKHNKGDKWYNYYWYCGGIPWQDVESIEDAIAGKDFDTFMKYKEKYPKRLPNFISVFEQLGDESYQYEIVDRLDVSEKENFMKITYSEYENG